MSDDRIAVIQADCERQVQGETRRAALAVELARSNEQYWRGQYEAIKVLFHRCLVEGPDAVQAWRELTERLEGST